MKHPSKVCKRMQKRSECCHDAAAGTIDPGCTKHRCSPHPGHLHAARYRLTPQQSIPTTASSDPRRERATVRARLTIPRHLHQEQPCWLFGGGGFLDLPYRVVAIGQVHEGDANGAHWHVRVAARELQARRLALMACTVCPPTGPLGTL